MNTFSDKCAVFVATGFGSGLAPKAPGTFGSMVAIPLLWASKSLIPDSLVTNILILIAVSTAGFWATHRTETLWGTHDDSRIVVDEIAGMFATLIWFPLTLETVIAGFVLFRIFDIWKPGPIGHIDENWHGAWGTFFDDVLAGAVSAAILAGYFAMTAAP